MRRTNLNATSILLFIILILSGCHKSKIKKYTYQSGSAIAYTNVKKTLSSLTKQETLSYGYYLNNASHLFTVCTLGAGGAPENCNSAPGLPASNGFAIKADNSTIYMTNTVAQDNVNPKVSYCQISASGWIENCKETEGDFNYPSGITITPDQQNVLITNQSYVSACLIDSTTNALSNCMKSENIGLADPISIAIFEKFNEDSVSESFAFVTNLNSSNPDFGFISICKINTDQNPISLEKCSSQKIEGIQRPYGIFITPQNYKAYISDIENNAIGDCIINTNADTPSLSCDIRANNVVQHPTQITLNSLSNSLTIMSADTNQITNCHLNNNKAIEFCNTALAPGSDTVVMPLTVDRYNNQTVFTTVKICNPNPNPDSQNCMTLDKIQVDTGSAGLIIYKDISSLNLEKYTISDPDSGANDTITECASFVGYNIWGPLAHANVTFGNFAPGIVSQNMLILESNPDFAQNNQNNYCPGAKSPDIDGILGIGAEFIDDCLRNSFLQPCPSPYFRCPNDGSECETVSPIAGIDRLPNPFYILPVPYNNGYIMSFPQVPLEGTNSLPGATMVLGIGTEAHNIPIGNPTFMTLPTTIKFSHKPNLVFKNNYDTGNFGIDLQESIFLPSLSLFNVPFPPPPEPLLFNFPTLRPTNPTDIFVSFNATLYDHDNPLISKLIKIEISNGETIVNNWFNGNENFIYKSFGQPASAVVASNNDIFLGLPFFYGKTIYFGNVNEMSTFDTIDYTGPIIGLD